jgi:hypothetical protein
MIPRFDVFFGKFQSNNALWMDCANDLDTAEEMMKKMAVENPGRYFIFSAAERRILTIIDTTQVNDLSSGREETLREPQMAPASL